MFQIGIQRITCTKLLAMLRKPFNSCSRSTYKGMEEFHVESRVCWPPAENPN